MLGKQNLLTLDPNPIPADIIPKYPTLKIKTAQDGDYTYRLDPSCRFADGKPAIVTRELAEIGEKLLDIDLRYIADTSENEMFRGRVKALANSDPGFQEMEKKFCKSSILYFVNVYCYTKIPGKPPTPFVTYPFQDDILTWGLWLLHNQVTGLVEKSRDMGMSWCMEALIAYVSLFFDEMDTFQLSMTEKEVDNKTEHSLFGKLRYLINNLPPWLRGGWNSGQSKDGNDLKMLIRIPETRSVSEGVLTGGEAGRGGRVLLSFFDEFAHVKTATEAVEASASAAKSKIYLSTVKGMDNLFAEMAHDPRTFKKTLHWKLHPLKTKEWAIKERARPEYNEEVWAQEHDIKYDKSSKGRVYPMFRGSLVEDDNDDRWTHVQFGEYFEYDDAYNTVVGVDLGLDSNSVVYCQIKPCLPEYPTPDGRMLVIFDEDQHRNQLAVSLARMLNDKGYHYERIIVDLRTGEKRSQVTKKTIVDVLNENGLVTEGKYNSADAPIEIVRFKLGTPGAVAINGENCPLTIRAFQNWSFPVEKHTGLVIPGSKPKHDQNSHIMKATAYLFDKLFDVVKPRDYRLGKWDFKGIPEEIAV